MRTGLVALMVGVTGVVGCAEDHACGIVSSIGLVLDAGVGTITATAPSATELAIDFGDVPLGIIETATIRIVNSGAGALALSLVEPNLDPEFSLNPPKAIASDSPSDLSVTFQPYKVGAASSTVAIDFQEPASCPNDAGSNHPPVTLNLTGTGVQVCLIISPNVIDFGATQIGTTATKTVTLTTCEGTIDGLVVELIGRDASLFSAANPPTSLGPLSSVELEVTYAPTALEVRSLASLDLEGSRGERSSLNLFGEPTDKDDGGVPCLPGGDYCCADDATIVAVGQSDQGSCRTCTLDAGVASWSVSPVGTPCTDTSYGDAGNAGVCVPTTDSESAVCFCSVSFPEYLSLCGRGTFVDADAGVFPCCFGECILDAGATVGICPCLPGRDGGGCP